MLSLTCIKNFTLLIKQKYKAKLFFQIIKITHDNYRKY